MCGICGVVGETPPGTLARMVAALAHRGPDDSGTWTDPTARVSFGHRRLAVLDLLSGHQPMLDAEHEHAIVFNGEIYNFAELRVELTARGHHFVTNHSDTEVLLRGYREWGHDLPRRLNGMWAFALLDRRRRQLFLSRDRFGEKPLYYTARAGTFVFASELSALRHHPATPTSLSQRALIKYFGYGYIPSPLTIIEGVEKLPPAHSLVFDLASGRTEVKRYWEFVLDPFEKLPRDPVEEWGAQLRSLLDIAVKRRMVADVPVGVFLSGGIDSSAVTMQAARHAPAGLLKTFSVGFTEPSFDESIYARRVAALAGTDHHVEMLSIETAHTLFPEIVSALDEPMGDSSLLPTYLLGRFTRRHVTVALSGDGGDELFAGYDPFRALHRAQLYAQLVPRPVHEGIRMLAARLPVSHRNMSFDFKLKRTLRGLSERRARWLPVWMAPLDAVELSQLFGRAIDLEDVFSEAISIWESCPQRDSVSRALQFYTRLYLADDILTKVDRATMRHGLESRAPFLDNDLVDFVRRIPADWKYRRGETKFILRRALTPVLPAEILRRPKKGFGVPIGAWFQSGALAPLPGAVAGLNEAFVDRAIAAHRTGRQDQRAFLWNYTLLQHWCRNNPVA